MSGRPAAGLPLPERAKLGPCAHGAVGREKREIVQAGGRGDEPVCGIARKVVRKALGLDCHFDREGQHVEAGYGRGIAQIRSGNVGDGRADIAAAERSRPGMTARFARFGITP